MAKVRTWTAYYVTWIRNDGVLQCLPCNGKEDAQGVADRAETYPGIKRVTITIIKADALWAVDVRDIERTVL